MRLVIRAKMRRTSSPLRLLGQRPALAQEVARLDRGDGIALPLGHEEFVETPDRVQPPIDRGRRQSPLVLPGDEAVDVAPGHLAGPFPGGPEEEAQVKLVIEHGVRRVAARAQVLGE